MGTTASQKKLFFNLRRLKGQLKAMEEGDLHPENLSKIAETLGVPEQDVVAMNRRLAAPDHSLNAPLRIDGDGDWQDWLVDDTQNQETLLAESDGLGKRRALPKTALSHHNAAARHLLQERRPKATPNTPADPPPE